MPVIRGTNVVMRSPASSLFARVRDRLVLGGWLHHACCRCQRDRPGHFAECQAQWIYLCRRCRREIAPRASRWRLVADWLMGARPHQVDRRTRKRGWRDG